MKQVTAKLVFVYQTKKYVRFDERDEPRKFGGLYLNKDVYLNAHEPGEIEVVVTMKS